MRRTVLLTTPLLLTLQCGHAPPAPRPTLAPPPRALPPAGEARIAPAIADPWVALERDGARALIVGALRVEARGDEVEVASQVVASAIDAAVELDGGRWVFHCADGLVATSATFLGPLRRLGAMRAAMAPGAASRGRAVFVDWEHRAWATDGEGPLAPLATLPPGAVMSAAFVDASHGAVVLDGGALVRTADGGRTWQPVDLGADVATGVYAAGTSLVVRGPEREQVLEANGTLAAMPVNGTLPEPRTQVPRPELFAHLVAPIVRRFPALLAAHPRTPRGSGEVYYPTAPDVWVFDAESGAPLRHGPATLGPSTVVTPWGDAFVTYDIFGHRHLRSEDGLRFTPMPFAEGDSTLFSDDGLHAVLRGRCGADAHADETRLCAVSAPGAPLRPLETNEDEMAIELRGTRMLVHSVRPTPAFAVLDVDSGERTALTLARPAAPASAPPTSDPGAEEAGITPLSEGHFTADGGVYITLDDPPPGRAQQFAIGSYTAPLAVRDLPEHARYVGFADLNNGLAAGRYVAEAWTTHDGGRHWAPVPAPIEGNAASLGPATATRYPTLAVSCRPGECVVHAPESRGGWLVVRGFERVEAAGPAGLATQDAPPTQPPSPDDTAPVPSPTALSIDPRVTCSAAPGGRPARSAVAGPEAAAAGAARSASTPCPGAGAVGALELNRDASGAPRALLRWSGLSPSGVYHALSAAGPVPAAMASTEDVLVRRTRYRIRAASPAGALVEGCVDIPTCVAADTLVWFPARGAPVAVMSRDRISLERPLPLEFVDAQPRPGGGFAVLTRSTTDDTEVHTLRVYDAAGRPQVQRAIAWPTHPRRAALIMDDHGTPGIAFDSAEEPRRFAFLPVSASAVDRAATRFELPRSLGLCRGPAAPGAPLLTVPTSLDASDEQPLAWTVAGAAQPMIAERVWIEVPPGGPCVRAVDSQGDVMESQAELALSVRATSGARPGATATVLRADGTRTPLRCTVAGE